MGKEVNPSQPITTSVWKADGKDKNWSKLDKHLIFSIYHIKF